MAANRDNGPQGLTQGLLRFNGDIDAFRAASPLPVDAQRMIDNAVIKAGLDKLVIVDDLIAAGLTFPMPNWLAVPTLYVEAVNRTGYAQRTMVPKARGERQMPDRNGQTIPIFCTWDDFSLDIRTLLASQRAQAPLDTTLAEQATRNVNEAFEDQAINGADIAVAGLTAPGFLTAPVNLHAFVDTEAWTHANHSGEDILKDVMALVEVLQNKNYGGPYNLYVPPAYGLKLGEDYKSATSGTILERITSWNPGVRPINVRVASKLPADHIILCQMTSDVVDVIQGQQPTEISWSDGPDFERFFVVLGCAVTRIKQTYDGDQGFVVGTPSGT